MIFALPFAPNRKTVITPEIGALMCTKSYGKIQTNVDITVKYKTKCIFGRLLYLLKGIHTKYIHHVKRIFIPCHIKRTFFHFLSIFIFSSDLLLAIVVISDISFLFFFYFFFYHLCWTQKNEKHIIMRNIFIFLIFLSESFHLKK